MPYGIRAQLPHGKLDGVGQLAQFPVLLKPDAGAVPGLGDGAEGVEGGGAQPTRVGVVLKGGRSIVHLAGSR